jgi:hypothetical protein
MIPPICRSPTNWVAIATPLAYGVNVSSSRGSQDFETYLAPADPGVFPPSQRVDIFSIATSKTEEHDQPASRWTLDDIAATIINEAHAEKIHRSTIWRILNDADIKPHKSVYWLNSHDPDFESKARGICQLYLKAPQFYQQGRLLICCDEKTGMQILQRNAPTKLVLPGQPEKQEFEYKRLGTRTLMSSFVVPTGEVVWDLGQTRTNFDFVAHIWRVTRHFHKFERIDWIVDNLNTHCSLPLCERMAHLNGVPFKPEELQNQPQRRLFLSNPEHRHVFHYVPLHGSWLNQVELWFSVLSRQFLRRASFTSVKDFEERLRRWLDRYNQEQAHPYQWTYTGEPMVRATPFSQTRRQQRKGRAWAADRPMLFTKLMYPPRPYKRKSRQVAANL